MTNAGRLTERLRYAIVKTAYARELLDANADALERARLGGVLSEIAAALDAAARALAEARDSAPPPFSGEEPRTNVKRRLKKER